MSVHCPGYFGQVGKQLSRQDTWKILVVACLVWIALATVGAALGWALAPDHSRRLVTAAVGAMMGSIVWVAFCWAFGVVLRSALIKRGYDVPGRAAD
jgi:uncharacterized BrkB/YihY/UPF0761 family membrane protein